MAWRTLIAVLPALSQAMTIPDASEVERRDSQLSRRETGINAMCWWTQPSCAIIRDQLYINGGKLTTANITNLNGLPQLNPLNIPTKSYFLNLGTSFNTSEIPLQTIDVNFPQVTDGFMAANDNSFWLYGGLIAETDSISLYPQRSEIQQYDVYQQGVPRDWRQGWQSGKGLNDGISRYVAGGAGVNVRETNQTFYFSGARNPTWGEIRGPGAVHLQYLANATSQQLISADLSDQQFTNWTNATLPSTVRPRVDGEMVYVPAGKRGALIVIGGVTSADWQSPENVPIAQFNAAADKAVSTGPSFLSRVEVYDMNANQWYIQNTTGDAPTTGLAQFCAIVATSQDGNSHQIYIYGGYPGNGRDTPLPVYDSVYVLSIPAFHWIKITDGSKNLGRQGHRCVKPLPDKMFIVGGATGSVSRCVDIIKVFNLNTLQFSTEYDPAVYEDYKVPSAVRDVIGGGETGGATKTASRWAAPTLEQIFMTERPPSKATTWYPYSSAAATSTPSISIVRTKSETPKFVYPVVAVCIVIILAVIGGLIAWFCIRRKRQQRAAKAAGNEQFQNSEKDNKLAGAYQQYPADPPHGYNSYGSVSTVAPAYSQHMQDNTPQIFFELPAEPKGPAELDSGAEYSKLGVISETQNDGSLSIVPTPATEHSDPLGTRQTRRSVFSEATAPMDTEGVSPLTPDPEIAGNSSDPTSSGAAQFSWWRRQSMRGSAVARKISDISFRSLSRSSTGLSRSESLTAPAPAPAGNGSSTAIAPANVSITPPSRGSQSEPRKSQNEPSNASTESMPTPPPTNTN
ncbi:hypothetical protein Dda_3176 [Drechslerella dactyloides]|uniref:Uncharacterized protein n=1 Tax=Drechslerella dactyloides TaxID=74499 RepID=A0AAD6J0Z3_DREDA|nr:hypothetical protein Dda_3176 [Drechslerella dactyloides]